MRSIVLVILLVAALPAAALDCATEMPRGMVDSRLLYRDVIACLIDEAAMLRRDQERLSARLRATEEALAATLAQLPADYANLDGKVEAEPGRPVGRARFVLSARTTGGPTSLPLDPGVVAALCGDAAGCSLRLARRDLGLNAAPPEGVGPRLFLSDPDSGGWFRSAGCGGEGARGTDGSGGAIGSGGGEILAEAGGACLLADAEARRGPGPDSSLLAADQAPGLYLIAAPARAPGGTTRFRCELTLE